MGTFVELETCSPTESDRPLVARFVGGVDLEVFSGMSVVTAAEHLRVLLMCFTLGRNVSHVQMCLTDA